MFLLSSHVERLCDHWPPYHTAKQSHITRQTSIFDITFIPSKNIFLNLPSILISFSENSITIIVSFIAEVGFNVYVLNIFHIILW